MMVKMNTNFKALTLSYKNAPIAIRERFSLSDESIERLLSYFKEFTDATDVLLISTCNRTEVYYSSDSELQTDIIKMIGIEKGLKNIAELSQYFIYLKDKDAVNHLFNVSMGLEAQVVGDIQISNQVKRAYQKTADMDLAGPFLHRLMHTIFFTNKRVVQETSFRDGAASVSYAAVELVEELSFNRTETNVLILGVGEIGTDVCKNLASVKKDNIKVFICNRTLSKSKELAQECGFEVIPFENAEAAIFNSDIIISSIARETPFITKELISKAQILSYKYFIDLSVPRSVEMDVEEVAGSLVYNIDTIKNKTTETLKKRIEAIPAVKQIIEEALAEFYDWQKEMMVSPTIQKLKNALEQIRKEEITRHLKSLSPEESEKLEKITKNMMQKIIKLPVLQLKAACKRGEADTLIDVLNNLFNLEATEKVQE
jgi:glutamyl-tRNA reductase